MYGERSILFALFENTFHRYLLHVILIANLHTE